MNNKKISETTKAVTEIVGTTLLLAMAIALFTVLNIMVMSIPLNSPSQPSVNLMGGIDDYNIIIEHQGGETLGLNSTVYLTIGGYQETLFVHDLLDSELQEDGAWNIGERLIYTGGVLTDLQVKVTVVDEKTNSIILRSTLQDGLTTSEPSVITVESTDVTNISANLWMNYNFRAETGTIRFSYKPESGTWKKTAWEPQSGSGTYNTTTIGLANDTTYYYKAQLKYDTTEIEGVQKSFTTEEKYDPLVTTVDATDVTNISANLWMNYNFRAETGTIRFSYKPESGTWKNTAWEPQSGSGTYNTTTIGLTDNTTHYYKAQLQYDSTVIDGNEKSFTTLRSISVDTAVDTITPYEVTTSPLTITATGDQNLDEITLYYHWSSNNGTGDWTTLTFDDFEEGFGNYTDGGSDCSLYTGATYAHQGSNAADIQDNDGIASSFYHTNVIDIDTPGYTSIKVDFWFYAVSMESNEDFWVQYYDGSTWHTVADYDSGDEFVNGQFYHEIVWINETGYTFPSNMKIRFLCDAFQSNDDVYIDEIWVNATPSSTNWLVWTNGNNPDSSHPWSWMFDFPYGNGYYEFYSIGRYAGSIEDAPMTADARCYLNS